jgi:adenylate cyclase
VARLNQVTNSPNPAGRQTDRRKLVAVVHADVVGYSRLIGLDDTGTLERLRALRRELIDPAVAEHGGRIVNIAGDALLIVFDSVDGAVRCALAVQQQVPAHEADQNADHRIGFRIGVNVGDAIPDGTDLHGDVVNVAARLQAECLPGGVCISRAVREHVRGRFELPFELMGSLNLKNIDQRVEAFVLRPEALTVDKSVERTLVHGTGEALPLPTRPSIAVLAFTNMSGDSEQEHFSDGIADDIITELSRSRSLFVIARNSSFTYKGRAVDIKLVARELGVRYVLEGSVRRSLGRVRVTAQLIDAETGNHIWAERYDRTLEDWFAVQDEITAAVVTAIIPAVADAELRRVLRRLPESLDAWEAYQRGLWHLGRANLADNDKAKKFFEQAIALDAAFAPPYAAMAETLYAEEFRHAVRPVPQPSRATMDWARRAVELDPDDADAQAILAQLMLTSGNHDECWRRLSLAISTNPNSAFGNYIKGSVMVVEGRPSEGRAFLLAALRLDPRSPHGMTFLSALSCCYYLERDYPSALETAKHAVTRYPDDPLAYRWLAAALGQLGQTVEARAALHDAITVSPTSFDFYVNHGPHFFRPEDHEHMLDGLRKAGWQG